MITGESRPLPLFGMITDVWLAGTYTVYDIILNTIVPYITPRAKRLVLLLVQARIEVHLGSMLSVRRCAITGAALARQTVRYPAQGSTPM